MSQPSVTPAVDFSRQLFDRRKLTPTQAAAIDLYGLGFNILPGRRASKLAYLWGVLRASRLHANSLVDLFDSGDNLFCMTGRTSLNLFVVDCETRDAAKKHGSEFAARGIEPWVVATARGAHFWLLSADGEVANVADDVASPRGYEIRGNANYVACPPSLHPTFKGFIYDWRARVGELPPSVSIADMN